MNGEAAKDPSKIVVIGGSQGAIEALLEFVPTLPPNLPAAIFVVVHVPVDADSYLPSILTRAGGLRAAHASDGEPIRAGRIYVAPPNYHLTVSRGEVHVRRGPRENRHRPAIDPLFRTAARAFGPDVLAIMLSGNFDDGSAGLLAVRSRGGLAIVQDPEDAQVGDMPQRAAAYAGADYILPAREIGPKIVELVNSQEPAMKNAKPKEGKKNGKKNGPEDEVRENEEVFFSEQGNGKPSVFACPECHGVLWEVQDGKLTRFRCRVGHGYTADSLNGELDEAAERALWAAMRALEEKAAMLRRMAVKGPTNLAHRLNEQAEADTENAHIIRKMIFEED